MADALVLFLDWILAELLTITWVIGRPPIAPEMTLPTPWANNSRFVGVTLLCGSILSVASTQSSVSKLATTQIVIATIQTSVF
ncbi:MAG: Uncharacterised protein [Flavobacteriaceae bacterium]|nr:MAG: Uncharacterised protein [Flavobacteriaceae bacterium]